MFIFYRKNFLTKNIPNITANFMAQQFLMTINAETYDALNYYKQLCFMAHHGSRMCKYMSFAAAGVDPAVMGVGLAVAIPAVVKATKERSMKSHRLNF
jgi:hypothetical protein